MPSSIGFNKGSHFLLDGREVQVSRVINGGLITLEDVVSLVVYQYPLNQLLAWWSEGRVKPKTYPHSKEEHPGTKSTEAVWSVPIPM
ncbi:hypothetical protein, partial [Chromobacterium violaceum]